FALVFTLAISTVLAKTLTVILAFRVMKPGRTMRRLFVSGVYNAVIPICVLIQLILSGVWLGTSPPYIDTDVHSEYSHVIILCNKGSVTSFYCVLAYLGTLALGSFTMAFLVRNLPDTFNEAKFLTFSMLVSCSVWVTFIPVYQSTKGKPMVAVEVFSILTSSAGLLGCIFFPKCYIILLRPDKISLRCLFPTNPPAGLQQGATSPSATPDSESESAASSPSALIQSPPDSESESDPWVGTWSPRAAQPDSMAIPLQAYGPPGDDGNQ
ncbi:vomeronasal type-2 receptor 116-like, partial [Meriones unguiculatus]|uniref:vomeronasal type-2 receptor 116-like n=1 Tax=Meriones unguiculatus TaxID=10047 RepID=UPI00293E66E5